MYRSSRKCPVEKRKMETRVNQMVHHALIMHKPCIATNYLWFAWCRELRWIIFNIKNYLNLTLSRWATWYILFDDFNLLQTLLSMEYWTRRFFKDFLEIPKTRKFAKILKYFLCTGSKKSNKWQYGGYHHDYLYVKG